MKQSQLHYLDRIRHLNYAVPDEDCPLDYVPNVMREAEVEAVLNNAFAFGGNNCATVFARYKGEGES